MSPEQKALVKETWQKVEPMADAAARLFYDRLFEIDATTRQLFKTTDLTEEYGEPDPYGHRKKASEDRMNRTIDLDQSSIGERRV